MCARILLSQILFLTAACTVAAQPGAPRTGATERGLVMLQHAQAKDLATLLGKHFSDSQFLAEPSTNALLITANPDILKEAFKLIQQLDRPRQTLALEVFLLEVDAPKSDGNTPARGLKPEEFSGIADEVAARLWDLRRKGQVVSLRRFHLTTLENQPGVVQLGENKALVTGVLSGAKGAAGGFGGRTSSRSITYREFGTRLQMTPRLLGSNQVELELALEESRLINPENAVVLGQDDNGAPIRATETAITNVKTRIQLGLGQALAVKDVQTTSRNSQAQTLVIVAARLLEDRKGK